MQYLCPELQLFSVARKSKIISKQATYNPNGVNQIACIRDVYFTPILVEQK